MFPENFTKNWVGQMWYFPLSGNLSLRLKEHEWHRCVDLLPKLSMVMPRRHGTYQSWTRHWPKTVTRNWDGIRRTQCLRRNSPNSMSAADNASRKSTRHHYIRTCTYALKIDFRAFYIPSYLLQMIYILCDYEIMYYIQKIYTFK
jgi:hypothetical protein